MEPLDRSDPQGHAVQRGTAHGGEPGHRDGSRLAAATGQQITYGRTGSSSAPDVDKPDEQIKRPVIADAKADTGADAGIVKNREYQA